MAEQASTADTAEVLTKCFLFQAADEVGRRRLAERAHRRAYTPGERIFAFGSLGQSMMVILSGTVRISRPAPKGKEIILKEMGVGEVLGEIAMLDGGERSAAAVAVTRCELLALERREVIPFLEANPRNCLKLLKLICAKLRRSDELMADFGFAPLPVRLAKTILFYAGAEQHGGKSARLSFTQTELADMVGGTRSSINRQLRAWQKAGVVDLKEGWLRVMNALMLSRVANGN